MDACSASVLLGRGAWKKAGTVLYLLAAAGGTTDKQPKTSGLSAQRQHKAENAAKAGNTRWNDNGNETDRSIPFTVQSDTVYRFSLSLAKRSTISEGDRYRAATEKVN